MYFVRDDEQLLISTLRDRFKALDVERIGWASLCVTGHEPPYPAATCSGPAEIVTHDIGRATARVGQRMLRTPEPPEPLSDDALANAGRVILRIDVSRVSAVNYLRG